MKTLFKILYYSNKNLPRNQFFKFIKGDKCIVFAFRMFDIDGNGEISIAELQSLLSLAKNVDEKTVIRAMKEIDGRTKKTIKFAEFRTLMNKLFE